MAELSNKARVGEAFDLLAAGLEPFVAQHMKATTPKGKQWAANFVATGRNPDREYSTTDPSFLLNVIIECWDGVFKRQLPRSTKNLVFTLRDKRNDWAHNRAIQPHDAQFALSGALTLLEAVDANEADQEGYCRSDYQCAGYAPLRTIQRRTGHCPSRLLAGDCQGKSSAF